MQGARATRRRLGANLFARWGGREDSTTAARPRDALHPERGSGLDVVVLPGGGRTGGVFPPREARPLGLASLERTGREAPALLERAHQPASPGRPHGEAGASIAHGDRDTVRGPARVGDAPHGARRDAPVPQAQDAQENGLRPGRPLAVFVFFSFLLPDAFSFCFRLSSRGPLSGSFFLVVIVVVRIVIREVAALLREPIQQTLAPPRADGDDAGGDAGARRHPNARRSLRPGAPPRGRESLRHPRRNPRGGGGGADQRMVVRAEDRGGGVLSAGTRDDGQHAGAAAKVDVGNLAGVRELVPAAQYARALRARRRTRVVGPGPASIVPASVRATERIVVAVAVVAAVPVELHEVAGGRAHEEHVPVARDGDARTVVRGGGVLDDRRERRDPARGGCAEDVRERAGRDGELGGARRRARGREAERRAARDVASRRGDARDGLRAVVEGELVQVHAPPLGDDRERVPAVAPLRCEERALLGDRRGRPPEAAQASTPAPNLQRRGRHQGRGPRARVAF